MSQPRDKQFKSTGKDCKAFMATLVGMNVLPKFMEEDAEVVEALWDNFCVPFVVDGMRRKAANQNHQVCSALEGK